MKKLFVLFGFIAVLLLAACSRENDTFLYKSSNCNDAKMAKGKLVVLKNAKKCVECVKQ
ncbi:hypothetical protein [Helicobacter sp.]|uniref:hypothetical protein n=1 Tax=Helicobacter sp. TaxID=218 RepID=UPI0025BD2DA7|nr:hypothetical protein [Helicobacter sp.]MCI5968531.1 hypothetical protein [Helicobacter sp.]MDY2584741.1 hypothetical protein [Helicobacter sp.]